MKVLTRVFKPLKQAAQAFFSHDVALRRGTAGVEIVLEQRPARARRGKPTPAELAERRAREELQLMRQQLADLLDELPETRSTLRHLVFVEQALHKKGLRALRKLPLEVVQRALEQFEGLVTNWSPVGLATLRSRMAVAVIERERDDSDADPESFPTAQPMEVPDSLLAPLEVSECHDEAALAAAYAALGAAGGPDGSTALEYQPELGSASAPSAAPAAPRGTLPALDLREVHG